MPRFVVLKHCTPAGYPRPTHFDLLLEAGEVCRTWALAADPDSAEVVAADALPDHRLLYLDYEGEIAGGRGSVIRYAVGSFEWLFESELEVRIAVASDRLTGAIRLKRVNAATMQWEFDFKSSAS